MFLCDAVSSIASTLGDWGVLDIPVIGCYAVAIITFWSHLLSCD